MPKELNDGNLKKALTVLDVMNFTEEERAIYEGQLDWLRMEASALKKMEEKGIEKGRIEGKIEGKIEIATKMKAAGMTDDTIQQITGLSADEIAKA